MFYSVWNNGHVWAEPAIEDFDHGLACLKFTIVMEKLSALVWLSDEMEELKLTFPR